MPFYFRSVNDEELLRYIALSLQPGLGPVTTRNLVAYCGSVEEVFRQKKNLLVKIPGIGTQTAMQLAKHNMFDRAEEELRFVKEHDIQVLFYSNNDYPQRLQHCSDAPVLLYYKGSVSLNLPRSIAIVGTRSATEYGKLFTEKFITDLKEYAVTIVSGLAYGIDICAHKAAYRNEMPTIGVVAHGLDRIYPAPHKNFAVKMSERGGLLTEYPAMTVPDRENFPSRNRIVAGISDATVVIEAAGKGGALITADIANSYNRDVFAVPGRVNDNFSTGCNEFIRQNRAALITSANDLLEMMGWLDENKVQTNSSHQRSLFIQLEPEEEKLCSLLGEGKSDADTLSWKSTLPLSKINSMLLQLEIKGAVKSLPGKMYQLI
jgi:DNA processing protein